MGKERYFWKSRFAFSFVVLLQLRLVNHTSTNGYTCPPSVNKESDDEATNVNLKATKYKISEIKFREWTRGNLPGGKGTIPTDSLVGVGQTHPVRTRASGIGLLSVKNRK